MSEDFPFGKFFKDADLAKSNKTDNLSNHLPRKKEETPKPEDSSDLLG